MDYKNLINKNDELQEKINSFRPLSRELILQLKDYYKVDLTYSSNALEGNSLNISETKIIIEDGLTIGGKPLIDHFEVIGHGEAYDFLYTLIDKNTITEENILDFHKLFYNRIDSKNAGKYRNIQVVISGSTFIPPTPPKVPGLIKKFVKEIIQKKDNFHPIEYAALIHKEIAEIHPFVDGNGRTARLTMNLVLLQAGYVVTIIPPILRRDYIDCLEECHKGNDKPFINFISNMVYESQKDYLRILEATKE